MTEGRWIMNRIGFVNFWYYDEEIFRFENGKLLLRGQNASGKSITTQSVIPFLLDGDRTPSHLDPFGSKDRRMEFYFLGDGERDESTGYLYLEFRRQEAEEYCTLCIGQRARKGKPMDFWGFILKDGRRIGKDVALYRQVGTGRIALEKAEIRKILGEDVPFTDVPREYKALVNNTLFGFPRMELYDQYIKLLVQVRAPKLSKEDFKPTNVYQILNESLQTLSDEDLRPMVDAMEKMDVIQEKLDSFRRAAEDVRAIRAEYQRYNVFLLGRKAKDWLDALEKERSAEEEEKDLARGKEALTQKERDLTEESEKNEAEQGLIEAELVTLADADTAQTEENLERARREAAEFQKTAEEAEKRTRKDREEILRLDTEERGLKGEKEETEQLREDSLASLKECQDALQWSGHADALKAVTERDVGAARGILRDLARTQTDLRAAKDILQTYEQTARERDAAFEQAEKRRAEEEEARGRLERALRVREEEREGLIEDLHTWGRENEECRPTEKELAALAALYSRYADPADAAKPRDLLEGIRRRASREIDQKEVPVLAQISLCASYLSDKEEERDRISAAKELAPYRREAAEASRKALAKAGIRAVPFYRAVEFAPGLSGEEAGLLERQLEDAGLLDALVVAEEDFPCLLEKCPAFADRVIRPEKMQEGHFSRLVPSGDLPEDLERSVEGILARFSESEAAGADGAGGGVTLSPDGTFTHGILCGRSEEKEEAEYVGHLAREKMREKQLRKLEDEIAEGNRRLEEQKAERAHLRERRARVDSEYKNAPDEAGFNEALLNAQAAQSAHDAAQKALSEAEETLALQEARLQADFQKVLTACRPFPYGRTSAEYGHAESCAREYESTFQDLLGNLQDLEVLSMRLSALAEKRERAEEDAGEQEKIRQSAARKKKEKDVLAEGYEEELNRPEVREAARRRRDLKERLKALSEEQIRTGKELAVTIERKERMKEREEEVSQKRIECTAKEVLLRSYFEEEQDLGLVFSREGKSLEACAREAWGLVPGTDRGRDPAALFTSLYRVFTQHSEGLVNYGTAMEAAFPEAEEGSGALRGRYCIYSTWNGKKLTLEAFDGLLQSAVEETELLIRKRDRELFEDILSKTISQQLTDRIAESRRWVQDMSRLMKIDTSMGLTFSLDWKPKPAENEGELDAGELETILARDYELLTQEDIERIAGHFRSRVNEQKRLAQEAGIPVNYMDLVRDALDYRRWFAFQMYFIRGEGAKKPLTNSAFNRFSGGEKAMAMYIPLFAAVNAQYKKAQRPDHPRVIALDEAFAGVDEKNISSMFGLVEAMDFDYIMNSQVLWGCHDTVPALQIADMERAKDATTVMVQNYTWNGHELTANEDWLSGT